jgi:zinc protease
LHQHVSTAPVVAFQYWVGVGSADEQDFEAGLAHVHEHMLFKGTETRGPGRIAADIEQLGGSINAWTSFDQTVYHALVPSRFASEGLEVLTDAVTHSVFDADELTRELEVIQEEIRRGLDSPVRTLFQRVYAQVYTEHPYGLPVIGTPESVASFTREHVQAFYERWYRPSNMTLVVVGDLSRDALDDLLDANFHEPEQAFAGRPARAQEPPQNSPRATVSTEDVQSAWLALAFRGPELRHPETPALDLLTMLLGHGESSLLFERVQRNLQLVDGISASMQSGSEPGMIVVSASFQPSEEISAARVIDAILTEVAQMRLAPPPRRDVDRVRDLSESGIHFGNETVGGIARRIGYYQTVAGHWEYNVDHTEALRRVSPRDIQQAAANWLRPESLTIGLTMPDGDVAAPTADELIALANDAFSRTSMIDDEAEALEPDQHGVVRTTLPGGATLLIQYDPSVETFAIDAIAVGGSLTESDSTAGATAMCSDLLSSGTEAHTAPELARALEELSASMWSSAGRHTIRLSMTGLASDFDASVELYAEALFDSVFPDDEVERVRRETLNYIRRQSDDLARSAFRLFSETLWAGHPLSRPHYGTADSVGAVRREQLVEHYQSLIQPERLVVSVVGNVDPSLVLRTLASAFPAGRPAGETLTSFSTPPADPEMPQLVETLRERQQAHIVLGYPTVEMNDERRLQFGLLAAALNGQGGRLFMDLRDAQSLAYSVSASSTSGPLGGYFAVYIATSPGKIDQALEGIRAQMQRVVDEEFSESELTRARRTILGRQDIFMQRPSSRAIVFGSDEIMGFGYDRIYESESQLDAIDATMLRELAAEFLVPDREIVAIVRPPVPEQAAEEEAAE